MLVTKATTRKTQETKKNKTKPIHELIKKLGKFLSI